VATMGQVVERRKKFSEETIQKVWEKGTFRANYDPRFWRLDECGAWIGRNHYGDTNSRVGWEIDHITPESEGGEDKLSNLRPLQWENKASKQEGRLTCPVTSRGPPPF